MTDIRESIAFQHWSIDKRVPLALILSLTVLVVSQTFLGGWWASNTLSRIEVLEKKVEAAAPQADRLTRVEVRLDNVLIGISEIKSLLRAPPR